MKRFFSALVMIAAAAYGVAGCGGDDDDDDNTGGTSGSSNSGGQPSMGDGGEPPTSTAGAPATNGGAPTMGNVTCDPTEDGVCQNATDCEFVADGTARITAGNCGKGCIGKAENCASDCITDELPMTTECATCYADTVNCTIEKCAGVCLANPEADACKECQVTEGCRDAFDACSGLPS